MQNSKDWERGTASRWELWVLSRETWGFAKFLVLVSPGLQKGNKRRKEDQDKEMKNKTPAVTGYACSRDDR